MILRKKVLRKDLLYVDKFKTIYRKVRRGQMGFPDISVIMPIYNAGRTLKKSINSILCQENVNFEIICIDDGSTDTSVEQIKELQKRYPQILLFKQDHKGSGPARNVGILAAKGRYVAFLDADDEFVDKKALCVMVNACSKSHADICGSFRIVCEDGVEQDAELLRNFQIPENGCFIEFEDFQYDYDYQSFIFSRNFLVKNKIFFPPYMRYQDPPFFLKAMSTAERFYVVPIKLYKYNFDSFKQTILATYISHILQGIRETLELSKNRGYQKLFEIIMERIGGPFRNAILNNLSDETMSLLLDINKISKEFQDKPLPILSEIYKDVCITEKLSYSHRLMHQIVIIKQHEGKFGTYFMKQNIHTVAVYGLGVYGRILINELKECGVEVVCGIDREVSEHGDLPVIRPNDALPECDALIVSLMEPEDVAHHYKSICGVTIYTFPQIIQEIADEIQNERY